VPKALPRRPGHARLSAPQSRARYGRATVAKGRPAWRHRAPPTVLWSLSGRLCVHTALPFRYRTVPRSAPPASAPSSRPTAILSRAVRCHALTLKNSSIASVSLWETSSWRAMPTVRPAYRMSKSRAPQAPAGATHKSRDHKVFSAFLALSPPAEAYDLQLEERRLNPHHHVRNIVALSDPHTGGGARAMADASSTRLFLRICGATRAVGHPGGKCSSSPVARPPRRQPRPPGLSAFLAPPPPYPPQRRDTIMAEPNDLQVPPETWAP